MGLVGDGGVPDDPAHVVEGERSEEVLVHLGPPAVQGPEIGGSLAQINYGRKLVWEP